MKNSFGQFSEETLAQFAEEYSFRTCQRGDGSYYGTGGQCRKGTETTKPEEKESFAKTRSNLQKAADAYTADGTKEEKIYKQVRAEAVKKAASVDPEIESKHKELLELEKKFNKTKSDKDFNKFGKADEEFDKKLDAALKKGENKEEKKDSGNSSAEVTKFAKKASGFRGQSDNTVYEDVTPNKPLEKMSKKELNTEIKGLAQGMIEKNGAIYEASPRALQKKFDSGDVKVKDSDIKNVKVTKNDPNEDDSPSSATMMVFGRKMKLRSSNSMVFDDDDPNYTFEFDD